MENKVKGVFHCDYLIKEFEDMKRHLEVFKKLKKNWNSYGAKPIDPKAIELAEITAIYIIDYLVNCESYCIAPTAEGGVAIQIDLDCGIDESDKYCPRLKKLLLIEIYKDEIRIFLFDDIRKESKMETFAQMISLFEIKKYLEDFFEL